VRPAALRLEGVSKGYGRVLAVDNVSLTIAQGEFFTLLGPSGSGKTTLLRLIAGFERPDSGRIELGGRDVTGVPPYARATNTVFQDYALFPHMTVAANVEYGLKVRHVAREDRRRRVAEGLTMVRLTGLGYRHPNQLSGGQRQRVALARAIVNQPEVLLLDEPLSPILGQYSKPHTRVWAAKIDSFDAYVFVTPEYNHGISGALKNAIDFLFAEWNNKAAGFVSYGGASGARAVEQLRLNLAEVQMATVRNQVLLSMYTDFENFSVFKPDPRKETSVNEMLDQLIAWGSALKTLREKAV